MTGGWDRTLGMDLDLVANWGAVAVVTLIEDHEVDSLQVSGLGAAVADRHMLWMHLPIPDVSVPGTTFEDAWTTHGEALRNLLRSGFDVLVHCKGGLGRAGMIAARILVDLGWLPEKAMSAVRQVRPGAIETPAQERYVRSLSAVPEVAPALDRESVVDRALGCLIGLAVGDALGTTLEFQPRDRSPRVADIVGGGPFNLRPGEWTDDTSMALALAHSLLASGGLNERDLMTRFVSWWRHGQYSSTGRCFDIGITTRQALSDFERTGNPLAGSANPNAAGNGSLMRLAPAVLHGLPHGADEIERVAGQQSRTTHGSPACIESCREFASRLHLAIIGTPLSEVLAPETKAERPEVRKVLEGSWRGKLRREVKSSGYVVHSLEAALWCVARTTDFEEAVILAANLGDDADTTAAITGQLAGALYGLSGIPDRWLNVLAWRERIEEAGRALLDPKKQMSVLH